MSTRVFSDPVIVPLDELEEKLALVPVATLCSVLARQGLFIVERQGKEPVTVWRGSVTDLVTGLAAQLTVEQLAELAGEAALAWREAAKKVKP